MRRRIRLVAFLVLCRLPAPLALLAHLEHIGRRCVILGDRHLVLLRRLLLLLLVLLRRRLLLLLLLILLLLILLLLLSLDLLCRGILHSRRLLIERAHLRRIAAGGCRGARVVRRLVRGQVARRGVDRAQAVGAPPIRRGIARPPTDLADHHLRRLLRAHSHWPPPRYRSPEPAAAAEVAASKAMTAGGGGVGTVARPPPAPIAICAGGIVGDGVALGVAPRPAPPCGRQ